MILLEDGLVFTLLGVVWEADGFVSLAKHRFTSNISLAMVSLIIHGILDNGNWTGRLEKYKPTFSTSTVCTNFTGYICKHLKAKKSVIFHSNTRHNRTSDQAADTFYSKMESKNVSELLSWLPPSEAMQLKSPLQLGKTQHYLAWSILYIFCGSNMDRRRCNVAAINSSNSRPPYQTSAHTEHPSRVSSI